MLGADRTTCWRELILQIESACDCGEQQVFVATVRLDWRELSLAAARELALAPAPGRCPRCDRELDPVRRGMIIAPDEQELMALARVQAEGQWHWRLLPRTGRWALDGGEELGEDLGELLLAARWGRALSLRDAWRELLALARANPQEQQGARLAPGLFVLLVRPAFCDDPEAEADLLSGELVGALDGIEGAERMQLLPLLGSLRERLGRWLEPTLLCEPGSILGLAVVDPVVLEQAEAQWLERTPDAQSAAAPAEPDPAAALAKGPAIGASDPPPFAAPEQEDSRWLAIAGIPARFARNHAAAMGILDGMSPTEAVTSALCALADSCRLASEVLADFPEAEATSLERVILRRGGVALEANLASLIEKGADAQGLHDQLEGMLDGLKGEVADLPVLCSCGESWWVEHLRSPGFAETYGRAGRLIGQREVVDATGERFVMLPGRECRHQIAFAIEGSAQVDVPAALWADQGRVRLDVTIWPMPGDDDQMVGALAEGPSVASAIVNAPLGSALLEAIGARLALGRNVIAYAPTTDQVILLRAGDERYLAAARRMRPDPPGSPLGFSGIIMRAARPRGRIHVAWRPPLLRQ